MLVLRSLFRPAAAAWLLCSMGTVQADEGVARVSDLRPSVGVASTTALRAAKQDTAAAAPTKPESKAGGCCDENGCGEGDGCCKCTADGCGECGCDGEGCGECGCRGEGCVGSGKNKGKSVGLLNRLFGSHGASSGKNSRSGSGAKGATQGAHGTGANGGAQGAHGSGANAQAGSGAGSHGSSDHAANGGHGSAAAGGSASQHGHDHAQHGGAHGNGADGNLHGNGGNSHGALFQPSSPHQWFGGNGHGTCPNCHCNPCRCSNGYCPNGQVDYGDRVFSCLFGWAFPSGACGQGLPLVGKYHMVYADQPGYVNPADTQLYSAQGYGMPMTVPLAPTVNYQYNYSSGIPASRITTIGTWNPVTSPTALPYQSW